MDDIDFVMRKIVLPNGRSIEVVYFGEQLIGDIQPMAQPMGDYVEEFIDALSKNLITPDDFNQ